MDKNKAIQNAQKFLQRGQIDKAIREYRKVVEADPQDVRTRMKVGDLLAKKGATSEACDTYLAVAETYGQQGFLLKAVAVYKQVLKIDPNLVDVNLRLAELYHQLGLVSDAMAQYQSVANFFEQRGDSRRSLETLQRVLDLDPDNATSRIKLAELYVKEGLTPDALGQLRQAATLLREQNRVEDWIRVVERLVYLDPAEVALSRDLAETYLGRGEPKRALAKLQVCFRADPRDAAVLKALARAFGDLGQPSKAASVYRELGRILGESGDQAGCRAAWQSVLKLAPGDAEALAALDQGASAAPAPSAAAPRPAPSAAQPRPAAAPKPAPPKAAAAAALGTDAVRKLLTETDVYIKYGLKDKALQHLERVLDSDPDSLEALQRLRAVRKEAGDLEGEVDLLARMVGAARRAGSPEVQALVADLRAVAPDHPEVARSAAGTSGPLEGDGEDILVIEDDADEQEAVLLDDGDADDGELVLLDGDDPSDPDEVVLLEDEDDDEVLLLGDDEPEGEPHGDDDDGRWGQAEDGDDEDLLILDDGDGDEVVTAGGDAEEEVVLLDEDDAEADEELVLLDGDDAGSDDGLELLGGDDADEGLVLLDGDDVEADEESVLLDDEAGSDGDILVVGGDDAEEEVLLLDGDDHPDPATPVEAEPEAARRRPAEVADDLDMARFSAARRRPAEVADDLDMARFFVQQGLEDEARETLRHVLTAVPDHPEALRLLAELEADAAETSGPAVAEDTLAGGSGEDEATGEDGVGFDDFDLAGELEQELASLDSDQEAFAKPLEDFQISADDVFSEFKKGVARAVSQEDADTHYDLGIAYREMGLVRDAIGEFELAAGSPSRRVEARTLVGICHRELGETERAVAAFEGLLEDGGLGPDVLKAIHFELADTHAQIDARSEAVKHFRAVRQLDPGFRGVGERLAALGDDGAPEPGRQQSAGSARRNDKVGYV